MSISDKLQTVAENQEKVFDAGKKSEHENFWYNMTKGGTRIDYNNAFGTDGGNQAYWGDIFYPIYDINPAQAEYMFYNFRFSDSDKQIDLESRLNDLGVKLDFSPCLNFNYAFAYCSGIETLPVIDMTKAVYSNYMFQSAKIKTVRKIILSTKKSLHQYAFLSNSNGIENITFEGEFFANINFDQAKKLTHDSLISAINALRDFSEDTSGTVYTIMLGDTNKAKLTDDELSMITNKGWTYA